MLKKHRVLLLLVIVLTLFSTAVNGQASNEHLDIFRVNNSIVNVNYEGKKGVLTAVRISKDGINYDYFLVGNNRFPLQLGNGDYTITILENVEGKKFKQVAKETITLKSANLNEVYLQSIQMISWSKDMNIAKKAQELTKNVKSDKDKVALIYDYIVNNINYDYEKANKLNSNYIPSVEETLKLQKGICYDYSSLFAAMLRSVDIPTKLIMGRKNDIKEYHAWNQVYLQDIDKWITVDTTYDAGLKKGNQATTMVKDEKEYKIEKQY